MAATSSAPSAEPWALPVFCLVGAGQPMIVRSRMNDGRSVSSVAASSAAYSASTSSWYLLPAVKSTVCTCQPYASYRIATSSEKATLVSSSIEMRLSS